MLHTCNAIILKRVAFGEADWIVTFLSKDAGRLSGIAKSARKSQKRFGGAMEPGTAVELICNNKGSSRLVNITEAKVIRPVVGAFKSLKKMDALSRTVGLALAFLQERQPAAEKFEAIEERLYAICNTETDENAALEFDIRWLTLCGYEPSISGCAICGKTSSGGGRWAFEFEKGGIVCDGCSKHGRAARVILAGDVAGTLAKLAEGKTIGDGKAAGPRVIIDRYIEYLIGRPFKVIELV